MNKEKLFSARFLLIFYILLTILINNVQAAPVLDLESDISLSTSLVVDNRYGSGSDYVNTDFNIENLGDSMLTVYSVSAISVPNGISVTVASKPSTIAPLSMQSAYLKITANSNALEGNQKVVIQVNSDGGTETININFNVDVLIPAKLGDIDDESTTIIFDTPKVTSSNFYKTVSPNIQNIGDLSMSVSSVTATNPTGGLTVKVIDWPTSVSPKSGSNAEITITAPVATPEGTYTSKINVYAGSAGTETFLLSIQIKYGIIMDVSIQSIDFSEVEIYEKKSQDVIISEVLGYKSIEGITFLVKPVTYKNKFNDFISCNDINSVLPASSKTVHVNLFFDGNAEPYEEYKWNYEINSNNAGSKTIPISGLMGLGVDRRIDELNSIKGKTSGDARKVIDDMLGSLEFADKGTKKGTFKLSELITIIALSDSTIDVVESYYKADQLISQNNHDQAYDYLVRGSVGAKMINTYSDQVTNSQTKDDIDFVNSKSHELMEDLIQKEASYYENNILNTPNINTLQKMNANYRLSELWGLLGNLDKEKEYKDKADEQNKQYNNLVDSGKDKRLEAEKTITGLQNGILSKWGSQYVLLNPFNYDLFTSTNDNVIENLYDAENEYRSAGEIGMADKTQQRINQIRDMFQKILLIFYIMSSFYVLLFATILTKSIKSLNSYKRDIEEVQLGEYLII